MLAKHYHYHHFIFSISFFITCCLTLVSSYAHSDENNSNEINLSATVQGNSESPKVLYVIPWASPPGPDQTDLFSSSSSSVLERVFSPIDRLEHQRHIHYLEQSYNISQ